MKQASFKTSGITNFCLGIALIYTIVVSLLFTTDDFPVLFSLLLLGYIGVGILRCAIEILAHSRRNEVLVTALLKEHGITEITVYRDGKEQ